MKKNLKTFAVIILEVILIFAVIGGIAYGGIYFWLHEKNPVKWAAAYQAMQAESSEPTTPNDKTKPTKPSTPNEPTEPDEPSDPSTPTDPTEPGEPGTPTKPDEPVTPTEPTEPTEPEEPSEKIIGAKEFIDKVNMLISPYFVSTEEYGSVSEVIEYLSACKLTNEDMQTAEIQTTWGVYNDIICDYNNDTVTYERKFEYRQRMRAAGLYEAIPSPTLSANEQEFVNEVNKMIDAETIKQYMVLNAISAYQKLTSDEKSSTEMFTAYNAFELMRQVYLGTAADEAANRTRARIYMTEAGLYTQEITSVTFYDVDFGFNYLSYGSGSKTDVIKSVEYPYNGENVVFIKATVEDEYKSECKISNISVETEEGDEIELETYDLENGIFTFRPTRDELFIITFYVIPIDD